MGNAEIDGHILACCDEQWRKVARIVLQASERASLQDKEYGLDIVARRRRVLVMKHRLEAAGNVWRWRRSEVRIPPAKNG